MVYFQSNSITCFELLYVERNILLCKSQMRIKMMSVSAINFCTDIVQRSLIPILTKYQWFIHGESALHVFIRL